MLLFQRVISGGNGGSGFNVGDVLSVPSLGNNPVGVNGVLTVSDVLPRNQIEIDEVQGEFIQSEVYNLKYYLSTGPKNDLTTDLGVLVYIDDAPIIISDGTHIKVHHKNHGMYSNANIVSIDGVKSDIQPIKLSSDYLVDAVGSIPVTNTVDFRTFENRPVSALNPGYVKIDGELISGFTAELSPELPAELTGVQKEHKIIPMQNLISQDLI